jgi:hypothetical protein
MNSCKVKLVFKKEMKMLNVNNFMYDLCNGMNLESIVNFYNLSESEIVGLLNEYVSEMNNDNREEFMFYESEGNFNILNRLDFGFLIG